MAYFFGPPCIELSVTQWRGLYGVQCIHWPINSEGPKFVFKPVIFHFLKKIFYQSLYVRNWIIKCHTRMSRDMSTPYLSAMFAWRLLLRSVRRSRWRHSCGILHLAPAVTYWLDCISETLERRERCIHCFKKKRTPFLFLRLLCVLLTDRKIFCDIVAKEICNKTHIFNFILMRGI